MAKAQGVKGRKEGGRGQMVSRITGLERSYNINPKRNGTSLKILKQRMIGLIIQHLAFTEIILLVYLFSLH